MNDTTFRTRNCRWIAVPGASDTRGSINFLEVGKALPFQPQRLFWLHHIAPGQWRGRHGHRRSELVLVPLNGGCRVHLDDGRAKDEARLDDPARGLLIGAWVWHELTDFAPASAVLAISSAPYDESDYLRDYDGFLREARQNP